MLLVYQLRILGKLVPSLTLSASTLPSRTGRGYWSLDVALPAKVSTCKEYEWLVVKWSIVDANITMRACDVDECKQDIIITSI